MSMKTSAGHEWIIPVEILEKHNEGEIKFIRDNRDAFLDWLSDTTGQYDGEHASEFDCIGGAIAAWGNSHGLQLSIISCDMDEDNEDVLDWLCVCENPEHPSFDKVGGEQIFFTTTG